MSTRPQGERALDMYGATNNEILELLGSMVGLTIGEKEANIFYIQDSGQKKVGRCYIDNTNMKLYRCIAATTSTSNTTANFTEINLLNHSDRLDNLVRYQREALGNHLTAAATIFTFNLDVPDGYEIDTCVCSSGINVRDISQAEVWYKSTTPISYSWELNGTVHVSLINGAQGQARAVDIIAILRKIH